MTDNGTPFAYVVQKYTGWTVAICPSLAAAVRCAREESESPSEICIEACYSEDKRKIVDEDLYSVPLLVTREEALSFIDGRAKAIAEASGNSKKAARMRGFLRCNPDDPIEQQIDDYIATAPRAWRDDIV